MNKGQFTATILAVSPLIIGVPIAVFVNAGAGALIMIGMSILIVFFAMLRG